MRKLVDSMTGRIFLILFAGTAVSALITALAAISESGQDFLGARTQFAVQRAQQLVLSLEAVRPEDRPGVLEAVRTADLLATLGTPPDSPGEPDNVLGGALGGRLARPVKAWTVYPAADSAIRAPDRSATWKHVQVTLRDGTQLAASFAVPQRLRLLRYQSHVAAFMIFFGCMGVLAFVVARFATRPLWRLSQAADALGADIDSPPIDVAGPREVRHTALAFNTMQARLRHFVKERTQMLAAITHDLQTPLTRLRLRIEQVADGRLRELLAGDLAALQAMSQEGLELARSMEPSEPIQVLDLDSLLDSVCADAEEMGQDVRLKGRLKAAVLGRPTALRRSLTNLVENAVKYGGGADVIAGRSGDKAVISVRDYGPGIPEQSLEAVFEPFCRLEPSRSRETGGTGIGLTIARAIAKQHGGRLSLRNHPEGGLEALLEIPLRTGTTKAPSATIAALLVAVLITSVPVAGTLAQPDKPAAKSQPRPSAGMPHSEQRDSDRGELVHPAPGRGGRPATGQAQTMTPEQREDLRRDVQNANREIDRRRATRSR